MELRIDPCIGVGDLKLGMTRAEVRSCLGEPDKVPDGDEWEKWIYNRDMLVLYFEDDRLVLICLHHPEMTLFSQKVYLMPLHRVIQLMEQNIPDPLSAVYEEHENGTCVAFGSLRMWLNFQFDRLMSAEIGYTEEES